MAFNISYIFEAVDNFSQVAEQVNNSIGRVKDSVKSLSDGLAANSERLSSIGKKLTLGVTLPLVGMAGLSLNAAAGQEKLNMQMEKLIGNAEQARKLGAQLENIKMNAPIDVSNLDDAALRLLTMGVSVDKVSGTLENLAKVSYATGESMDNMVEMFAVAQSSPEGMSRALNQLNRKIPIIAELQKMLKEKTGYDATTKQIREMAAKGQISMEALQKAMQNLTGEGGKFFTQFDGKSKTLKGAIQLLKNNFDRLKESVGFAIMGSVDLTGAVDSVNKVMKKAVEYVDEFAKNNPELTKTIVIFVGIAAALGPVLVGLGTAMNAISGIGKAIYFLLSPMGLMVAGFAAAAAGLVYLYTKFEWFRNIVNSVCDAVLGLVSAFPKITATLGVVVGVLLAAGKGAWVLQGAFFAVRLVLWGFLVGAYKLITIIPMLRTVLMGLNAVIAANPIMAMVAAATALGAGIIYLLDKFGLLDKMLQGIRDIAKEVATWFKEIFSIDIGGKIDQLKGSISSGVNNIKDKVSGFFGFGGESAPLVSNDNLSLGAQTIKSQSQSTVDINLKGNTAAIESVSSKTDGKTNLAVSQNMAYTY